jgi:hypothetical protein
VDVYEALVARIDELETQQALTRLVYDYAIGADHRDLERWRLVWTPDAIWQVSDDRAMTGIDEICAAVEKQWEAFPVMQHATVNHTVDIDGHQATGRCDVVIQVQLPDGRWITGGGTYEDNYRKHDGTWRIARRRVVRPFDLAPLAPSTGPIYDGEPDEADPE